jgi:hypothetical protein
MTEIEVIGLPRGHQNRLHCHRKAPGIHFSGWGLSKCPVQEGHF